LLNHALVELFSADNIRSQFAIGANWHQCAIWTVNTRSINFLQDRAVKGHFMHCFWRDKASALEWPADFAVLFKHQD
jgi:hypothetical protein